MKDNKRNQQQQLGSDLNQGNQGSSQGQGKTLPIVECSTTTHREEIVGIIIKQEN